MHPVLQVPLDLLLRWLSLFGMPFREFDLLWITIPVYLNWLAAEFYQEKHGTSFGNAISNGFVVIWVGIDWARTTVRLVQEGLPILNFGFLTKLLICTLMFAYGIFVVMSGIKVQKMTKYVGRIRVVSYACLVMTPIFYDKIPFDWQTLVAILLFFPAFYFFIELLDKLTPDPKAVSEDEMPSEGKSVPEHDSPTSTLTDPFMAATPSSSTGPGLASPSYGAPSTTTTQDPYASATQTPYAQPQQPAQTPYTPYPSQQPQAPPRRRLQRRL